MIPQAAVWVWFGISWLFIIAVLFKRWYHREHMEKTATEEALRGCKADTSGTHIWDA